MRRPGSLLIAVLTLFLGAVPCRATPMVAFSSTAPDLNNIHVGDTVTFAVSLSGLNPGDSLDFLGVDVSFDSTLLGTPFNITPGPIVPDPTGFSSGSSPGHGSGLYDDLFAVSALPIVLNGTFFTFDATAQAAGTGSLSFIPPPNSSGTDVTGTALPNVVAGPDLSFTIEPSGNATPEPATWLLLAGIGLPCLATLRARWLPRSIRGLA